LIEKRPAGRFFIEKFMKILQVKVDEKLDTPPVNNIIENPFEE